MHTKNTKRNKKQIVALDFFCGCGGFTHGMNKAGINVIAGLDYDQDVAYAYEKNNRGSTFINADISNIKETKDSIISALKDVRRDILVFAACAPCQPFSLHNRNHKNDSRRSLMLSFINVVRELPCEMRPDVILAENVGTMKKRGEVILNDVLGMLEEDGYEILSPKVLNAADYGVPQNRKRLIYLAIKKDKLISHDTFNWEYFQKKYKTKSPKTVFDSIGKLPPIKHGTKTNSKIPLHVTPSLSPINLVRLSQIKSPGGSRDAWSKEFNLRCYESHSGHKDVYGRMSWSKPAPTLTCRCVSISNGRYGHPEQNRAISLKEAALLQTMGDYIFEKPIILTKVSKQIGNAVPPLLAKKISKYIMELI